MFTPESPAGPRNFGQNPPFQVAPRGTKDQPPRRMIVLPSFLGTALKAFERETACSLGGICCLTQETELGKEVSHAKHMWLLVTLMAELITGILLKCVHPLTKRGTALRSSRWTGISKASCVFGLHNYHVSSHNSTAKPGHVLVQHGHEL